MEAAGQGRREAALGALAVLPDEVLCAVVDLLPPADIGRLACVSRYPPVRPHAAVPFCLFVMVFKSFLLSTSSRWQLGIAGYGVRILGRESPALLSVACQTVWQNFAV